MTSATPLPRRGLLQAGLAASTALLVPAAAASAAPGTAGPAAGSAAASLRAGEAALRELERRHGARLGVYGRNVRTGRVLAYRAGERFAMCSTFKALAAAAVLHGRVPLDRVVVYPPADLLPNSPVTVRHVADGMTVGDLCAAAIRYSDNTAGNLLLRQIGGPAGLTRFLRRLGDPVTRLDRWEPDLNAAVAGDPRDTTTPEALARSVERPALGRVLPDRDRARFVDWMRGTTTSGERFRKGLPAGWTVADKTGTGDYASANDVGVAWTTRRTPLVLAVLTTKPDRDAAADEPLVAAAARVLARTLAPGE
ncbi:class A beta-lactamase [Streptomyces tropicalis]|uniref:Beta-lactamase n=1 Tax=Streptomyces tropicalis TaxID=3034234 RepID=A0ABT6A1S7_9ACTN|nr:class A beta-lactamase [Streptomyces tropicalis]MDF3298602.1 class A beta-lactamase [Streptomyces tropicalis]